jgi:Ca2+-binding RTX toxin-like protein
MRERQQTLAPTVVITPNGSSTSDSPIVFTFQFSEAVTGFASGDVSVTNGTAGTFTPVDATTFTLEVTPSADGDVTVSVTGGAAQDGAGNDSTTSSSTVTFSSSTAGPVDVTLPGAGSYEVLRDGADLVVRIEGGVELSRAVDVTVLSISGSTGDDVVTVLDSGTFVDTPIVFTGGDGNDRFDASLTTGVVNLTGNGGDDVLIGGSGNDTLNGGTGKDELVGNAGDDLVQGQGSTGDTLDGGDGNDTLNGGSGNDLIREFFAGDAVLTNATMTGRGSDTVIDAERAELTGGGAAQTIDVSTFFSMGLTSVTLDGGDGNDTLLGSDGSDVLVGSGGSDRIEGNAGHDRIIGGSGADTLIGGDGDDFIKGLGGSGDRLSGGEGNDTLNGGRGVDRLIETGDVDFTLTTTSLTGLGTDVVQAIEIAELNGGESDNTIDVNAFVGFQGFTQLRGNGGNDLLIGSVMGDVLNGGDGNDTLLGKEGDDTLNGEDGNDGLSGFTGNDVIDGGRGFDRGFGGEGNDSLLGGNAADTLIGGDGDDTLAGNDGTDTLVGGAGNNDASISDVFNDATAVIDESFMLDPLPGWVDQV